jgi:3-(3-hydroxy-phenyl)propionate hydroxylase
VVGFGPIGATLAGLLGRRGLRVCVLEREHDVFPLPRAAHIDHMGLRALQELGCLDAVRPSMIPNPGLDFVSASREVLMRIPASAGSVSGLPSSLYFHQPGFDAAVRDAAGAQPRVDVRLDTEVTSVEQDGQGVTLGTSSAEGDGSVSASWVVGCDGASSFMRETVGLELENLDFDEEWLVLDLVLTQHVESLPRHAVHICDPARPHTAIPMPGERYRFELMLLPGEQREEMERPETVEQALKGWLPKGAARVERAAVYTFHGLVAREWRADRVLIAGDAAHQMPPFLGQGMCSGIRDAVNLAWKLDQVLAGAPVDLLDTYGDERRPNVRAITQAVVDFGEIICTLDPAVAEERDERLLNDERPPEQRLPFAIPRLQPGPLVLDGGGGLFVQPEHPVRDGKRLDDLVGPRFLVLARTEGQLDVARDLWGWRRDVIMVALDDLDDPEGTIGRFLDKRSADVVVVRPDRYVLYAGRDAESALRAVTGLLAPPASGRREQSGVQL